MVPLVKDFLVFSVGCIITNVYSMCLYHIILFNIPTEIPLCVKENVYKKGPITLPLSIQ